MLYIAEGTVFVPVLTDPTFKHLSSSADDVGVESREFPAVRKVDGIPLSIKSPD